MRFIIDLRKAQVGLFGASAKPAAGKRAGGKKKARHSVKTHVAKNPGGKGTHIVHEHERGEGTKAKPKPKAKTRGKKFTLTAPKQEAPDADGRKIHKDAGEVLLGARKHKWAEVHKANLSKLEDEGEAAAARHVTKKKVLGPHDPVRDRTLGSTPAASWLKGELFALVGAKPTEPGANFRRLYVDGCEWFKKNLDGCHTVAHVEEFLEEWADMARGRKLGKPMSPDELFEAIGRERGAGKDGWHGGGFWMVGGEQVPRSALTAAGFSDIKRVYSPGDGPTRYRLVTAAPELRTTYGLYLAAMGRRFGKTILGERGGSKPFRYKTLREAHAKEKRGDTWEKTAADGEAAAADKKSKRRTGRRWTRSLSKGPRKGGPRIRGSFTTDRMAKTFGLRGVQLPRAGWVNDEEAGKHIKLAHGALVDLADVLGLDRKMIAHHGKLGLAIGARGSGSASAHYEPTEMVINLTHTRGGGSLAHEWFHFIDHVLTGTARAPRDVDMTYDGKRPTGFFLSHRQKLDAVHPDVAKAWTDVMTSIHRQNTASGVDKAAHDREYLDISTESSVLGRLRRSDPAAFEKRRHAYNERVDAWRQNAKKLARAKGGRSKYASDANQLGDYWKRPHELAARAFESYVQDRLEGAGRSNPYLVDGTTTRYNLTRVVKGREVEGIEAYPQGKERENINTAFDALFAAVRTHGTLRKAMAAAMGDPGPYKPRALHVAAANTDGKLQEAVRSLEVHLAQAEERARTATSPLEVAKWEKLAHQIRETAGGARFSPVTGGDASGLPEPRRTR